MSKARVVQLKAKAATLWCQHATSESDKHWYYVLIQHDAIDASAAFSSLVSRYRFQAPNSNCLLCSDWPLFRDPMNGGRMAL
jgi:phosphoribosyl-dephospho-CoA transferase